MFRIACLASLALSLPAQTAAEESVGVVHTGARFCEFLKQDPAAMGAKDLLTQRLAETLSSALERNDTIQAAAPDEKPPLGDGIPWSSFPDRPDGCTLGLAVVHGHRAELPITYGFANAPDAAYTDTIILRHEDGAWRIDDIVYTDGQHLRLGLESLTAQ